MGFEVLPGNHHRAPTPGGQALRRARDRVVERGAASKASMLEAGSEARSGIGRWIAYYNAARPHSSFAGRTPDEVYAIEPTTEKLAA